MCKQDFNGEGRFDGIGIGSVLILPVKVSVAIDALNCNSDFTGTVTLSVNKPLTFSKMETNFVFIVCVKSTTKNSTLFT